MGEPDPSVGGISLRQLRAFIGVAEHGSFTAAAAALNLTQSAVSVLIADLERGLGLRLFDRTTRSVRLTEAGRELLLPSRRIMTDLQAAIASSRELAATQRGNVRIAATPLFSSLFLPGVILAFRSRYPGVDIIVRDTAARLVHRMVEEGEVDLAVGTAIAPEPPLTWDLLIMDEVVLVCPPGHELTRKKQVQWNDLMRFPFVAVAPESGTREIVDTCLEAAGVSLQPAFEVSSIWTLLGMVSAGLGVALTTSHARLLSPLYQISVLRIGNRRIDRPIGLMRHQNRSLSPAAAAFRSCIRDWVTQNIAAMPASLAGSPRRQSR
jgi:DNA-binding transcriptional LysR family regulator